jgi:nitrogen PTS system EIIA component
MRAATACDPPPPGVTSPNLHVFPGTPYLDTRMRLQEYLRPDFILPDLDAGDVEGVVREVSVCAERAGIGSRDVIEEKLLERERAHPTVMGSGLAIPHATVPGLPAPVIGVALAPAPVQFGPTDLDPVRVFFVLLSPPGSEREHVKLLARICRLARHDDFIEQLESAQTNAEVIEVIEAIDAQHV